VIGKALLRQEDRDDDGFRKQAEHPHPREDDMQREAEDGARGKQDGDARRPVEATGGAAQAAAVEQPVRKRDRPAEQHHRMRRAPPDGIRIANDAVEQQREEQDGKRHRPIPASASASRASAAASGARPIRSQRGA
jgi:hypothetical protein